MADRSETVILREVSRAADRRAKAEAAWRQSIVEAHAAGLSLRQISEAAGVSHPRVYQIAHGRGQ